eukprot:2506095-Rhodomonas_salina.1
MHTHPDAGTDLAYGGQAAAALSTAPHLRQARHWRAVGGGGMLRYQPTPVLCDVWYRPSIWWYCPTRVLCDVRYGPSIWWYFPSRVLCDAQYRHSTWLYAWWSRCDAAAYGACDTTS